MTKDELLEAIQKLRKMGFKVVKEECAHVPEQAKEQIIEDLEYYSKTISDRLEGLASEEIGKKILNKPLEAMSEIEGLYNYYNGEEDRNKYRCHEIMNLDLAALSIQNVKHAIMEGDIIELFRASVALGDGLPTGDALYILDREEIYLREREQTGGGRQDVAKFNEMKPFIFEEAARYWKKNPKALLKDVAKHITPLLEKKFNADKYPQQSTVRSYLKEAHIDPQNDFKIPAHALKPGRRS